MEEVKTIFKRTIITTILIGIYGVAVGSKEIYIGMFTGSLISILSLYLLYKDVQSIVITREGSYKRGVFGYIKRYALYILYLGIIGHIFRDLSMILCSAIGLLNVKGQILFLALSDKVLRFRDKNLK